MQKFMVRIALVSAALLVCWLLLIILEVRGVVAGALKPVYLASLLFALAGFVWACKIAPWIAKAPSTTRMLRLLASAIGMTVICALIIVVLAVNFKLFVGGSL